MEKNFLKQTENIGVVVGLLKSKKIEVKSNDNGDYITGNLIVEVSDGEDISEIQIGFMQSEVFKSGKENKSFKRFLTVRDEYNSIEDNGRENADTVKVYVKVEENNYYSKDIDDIKESIRLTATTDFEKKIFLPIEKAQPTDAHKVKINFEGRINKMENLEDGSISLEIVGIGYQNKTIKQKLIVPAKYVNAFMSTYYEGCTATLYYKIINAVEVKLDSTNVAFGEAGLEIKNVIRKNEILGGLPAKIDGAISEEDMRTILAQRRAELDELLNEKRNESSSASTSTNMFGSASNTFEGLETTGANPFDFNM